MFIFVNHDFYFDSFKAKLLFQTLLDKREIITLTLTRIIVLGLIIKNMFRKKSAEIGKVIIVLGLKFSTKNIINQINNN